MNYDDIKDLIRNHFKDFNEEFKDDFLKAYEEAKDVNGNIKPGALHAVMATHLLKIVAAGMAKSLTEIFESEDFSETILKSLRDKEE